MATNEAYKRGWIIPLTVGASVAARTPVCVGKIPGVTLTATGSTGTEIASVLRHGVCDLTVDSACDAVTLALASVTNTQTLIFNAITYTATTSTTTWSTRNYSIAGTDAADALLLAKAINGGQYLSLSGVTAGQTVTVAGLTFTAHGTTTTVANREFSIAGTDTQDATELVTCLTDGTYGIGTGYTVTQSSAAEILIQPFTLYPTAAYPAPVISKSGAGITISTLAPPPNVIASVNDNDITLKSSETISAVTGTASGATITVDHGATSTMPISEGASVYWTTPSTLNLHEGATFFGRALEKADDRKITLGTVTNSQTVIINGITFTAHTNTTTKSTRTFSIAGTDTQDADELCSCINDKVYGLVGFTATNNSGTITLAYDGDIVVTGTARIGGTVTTAPGSRKIRVKLGY